MIPRAHRRRSGTGGYGHTPRQAVKSGGKKRPAKGTVREESGAGKEEAGKRYGERRIRGGPGREEIGPGRNRVGSGRAGPWRGYSSPSSKYIPSIRASISRRSFFVGRPVPRSRKTKIVSRGADSFASSSAGVMLRQ